MKGFVAIVLVVVCATAWADKAAEWTEFSKECAQKNNISQDDIKKVISGEIKPADVAANMKCYFLCMSEKEGVMKDGVFQAQMAMEKINNAPNKDEISKAIAACKDMKGSDSCDTAFKIMSCISQGKSG